MKILLSVLPSFQSGGFLIPHLGTASLKAYIKKYLPSTMVNTIDLRTYQGAEEIWSPEDFPQITIRKTFVSDIYDLPLIASLIYNFKKYQDIDKLLELNQEIVSKWSMDRTIFPEIIMNTLNKTSTFALNHLPKFGGYDIVGFSLYTSNMYLTVLMALLIRLKYPKTKIIFGGPQITQGITSRELLLKGGIADYLILGEGEQPIVDLLNAIAGGESADNIIGIKSQTNFEKPDTFFQTMDLEELPTPNYDGTIFDMYKPKLISIYSNRGCPFRCHFCSEHSLFGKKFKRRSPEKVLEDMNILSKKHNITHFHFSDSLLNSSEEWLEEFIILLQKNPSNITWEGFFRAEMEQAIIHRMAKVGLKTATLGVESFSQQTLNKMNKKKVRQEILDTLHALIDENVRIFINLFVGYPGEKEEDYLITLEVANELYNEFKAKGKLHLFRMTTRSFQLRPFSNVYNAYEKFGIEANSWSEYYDDKLYLPELKNVFEDTLYSFKVKEIALSETLHRLYLLNQVKNKGIFLKEKVSFEAGDF